MVDLNQTACFVEVARSGGFAAAARKLGQPRSSVSARIQALEARLGVKLFRRSTRRVALTDAGRRYLAAVGSAVDAVTTAEAAHRAGRGVLSGRVRFTGPEELPRESVADAVAEFVSQHPEVRIEALLTNRKLDFYADDIDFALRGGTPRGAGQVVRKVGDYRFGLYASPGYISKAGKPTQRSDLKSHDLLWFAQSAPVSGPSLQAFGLSPPSPPKVTSDSLELLKCLALRGQGIAFLPVFVCSAEVAKGGLVPVLKSTRPSSSPLYVVFPSRESIAPAARALADHLRGRLAPERAK